MLRYGLLASCFAYLSTSLTGYLDKPHCHIISPSGLPALLRSYGTTGCRLVTMVANTTSHNINRVNLPKEKERAKKTKSGAFPLSRLLGYLTKAGALVRIAQSGRLTNHGPALPRHLLHTCILWTWAYQPSHRLADLVCSSASHLQFQVGKPVPVTCTCNMHAHATARTIPSFPPSLLEPPTNFQGFL